MFECCCCDNCILNMQHTAFSAGLRPQSPSCLRYVCRHWQDVSFIATANRIDPCRDLDTSMDILDLLRTVSELVQSQYGNITGQSLS